MAVEVSVIIAAYNAESFIRSAVESALRQTLRDIEVIVIDDGSRDSTARAATAAAAGDPRFHLIVADVNRGVAAARNAGLRTACGRWISVLDADDRFAPERLERLVAAANSGGADLLADDITLIYADNRRASAFSFQRNKLVQEIGIEKFIAFDVPGLESLPLGFIKPLLRHSFLDRFELNYSESISSGEDFDLYVRCLLRGARLFFVPESYYEALVRDDSLSRADPERNNGSLIRSMEALTKDAERLGNYGALRMLARRAADMASYADYSTFSRALHRKRFIDAARVMPKLVKTSYMWRRFALAARRRIGGWRAA